MEHVAFINGIFAAEQRGMAVDSSLLYWDMVVSFLLNLVGPLAIATLFSGVLSPYPLTTRVWLLILASAVYAFVINMCVLTFLQTTSCNGLKDFSGILAGAGISGALALFSMWVPSIWEGLRLAISQVFVDHHALLTPSEAVSESVIVNAGRQLLTPVADENLTAIKQSGGKRLTPEEYDDQTFSEIKAAMSYMSAFAGAYGIGIGSRYAVTCKK